MKVLGFSSDYHARLGPRIQLQQVSSMSAQICSSNSQSSITEAVQAPQDVLESSNSVWPLWNYRFFPFLQRKMTSNFVPEGQRFFCLITCRLRNHWTTVSSPHLA